jgi:hypothetical protein
MPYKPISTPLVCRGEHCTLLWKYFLIAEDPGMKKQEVVALEHRYGV